MFRRATIHSALPAGDGVPEWIHLLPAGQFRGVDGRGPYRLADAAAVIASSLPLNALLPIDQDHATDLAAPNGGPAPARGWIVALEARQDGIHAKVEWNTTGRALLEGREYRHISPVFTHDKEGRVQRILRASLTNNPNLAELAALHAEQDMDLKKAIAAALGLPEDASDEDVIAAVKAAAAAKADAPATMAKIAKAAGLPEDVSADALATALAAQKAAKEAATDKPGDTVALQSQVNELKAELLSIKGNKAREDAERTVEEAIKAGKPILAHRADWVELFMKAPETAAKSLAGLPAIGDGGRVKDPGKGGGSAGALDADQLALCAQLGITPEEFTAQEKKVLAKQEGR